MLRDLKTRIMLFRQEHPEKFDQRVNLAIGIFVGVLIIVASVNVASVITVFPV